MVMSIVMSKVLLNLPLQKSYLAKLYQYLEKSIAGKKMQKLLRISLFLKRFKMKQLTGFLFVNSQNTT